MFLEEKKSTCLIDPGLWLELSPNAERFGKIMRRPALFLDRDGVLNKDTGYVGNTENIVIYEELLPVIRLANKEKLPVIMVTNQSGIARGYYGWDDFAIVNAHIVNHFARFGAGIDAIYACAYHQDAIVNHLRVDTQEWRKPAPGMLYKAAEDLPIQLADSLIIGDKLHDMKAGAHAGLCDGILLAHDNNVQECFKTMRIHGANRKTITSVALPLLKKRTHIFEKSKKSDADATRL